MVAVDVELMFDVRRRQGVLSERRLGSGDLVVVVESSLRIDVILLNVGRLMALLGVVLMNDGCSRSKRRISSLLRIREK